MSTISPAAGNSDALGAYASFQCRGVFGGGRGVGLVADLLGFRAVPLACLAGHAATTRSRSGVLEVPAQA